MATTDRSPKPQPKPVQKGEWPPILQRYVKETGPVSPESLPRRIRMRYQEQEMTLWEGFVHVDDVQGYVENIRLKFFLNRWLARRGNPHARPTTEDIYEIMLEADREETKESKKPFHVERMAESIARNGVHEPITLFANGAGPAELWDGNRRFFGTTHIMKHPDFRSARDRAKWIPALVYSPSGRPDHDAKVKHAILTELNFVEKDHIPWPAYVKAEQIYLQYKKRIASDPADSTLSRTVKEELAAEYGLKGWRVADRWIKMYGLAARFKEYHEEEHSRDSVDVDLKIQEKFEYFDEMSKPGVWGAIDKDPDAQEEVYRWLWDDKFKAFADVRMVPKILADSVARRQANADDSDSVKRAIETVIINDPVRAKDKEAANEKIAQFAMWLNSFNRADYNQLDIITLENLRQVLADVTAILGGLLSGKAEAKKGSPAADEKDKAGTEGKAKAKPEVDGKAKATVVIAKGKGTKGGE
jgi:hypothetical protein